MLFRVAQRLKMNHVLHLFRQPTHGTLGEEACDEHQHHHHDECAPHDHHGKTVSAPCIATQDVGTIGTVAAFKDHVALRDGR